MCCVCLCVARLTSALSVRQCDEVVPVTLKTFRTELSSAAVAAAADMDSRMVVRTVTSRRSVQLTDTPPRHNTRLQTPTTSADIRL